MQNRRSAEILSTTIDTSTAAVTALLDGVTPGPWVAINTGDETYHIGSGDWDSAEDGFSEYYICRTSDGYRAADSDAAFLAAARHLVPALLAERDDAIAQADARVAAAYEDAANELQRVVDNWDCGHMESRLCDCAAYVEQWELAANTIREITMPAGARAALDRLTAQARAAGMREAAEIVSEHEEVELLSTLVRVLQKRSAGNRAGITFAEAILSRADEIEKGAAR